MEEVEASPVSLAAADGAELGTAKNDEAATEDEVGSIVELPGSTDWEGAASEVELEVELDVELSSKSAAAIDWVGRAEEAEGSAEVLFEEGLSAVGS
jgi:hypothetical protein